MAGSNQNDQAILFCNTEQTVILVDIPRSVAEAQLLSRASAPKHASALPTNDASRLEPDHESASSKSQSRWSIVSAPPLEEPYPATTEPKTESSRRKVLSRISKGDQRYHDEFIRPLVVEALNEIQSSYSPPEARWCLPRVVRDEGEQQDQQAKASPNDDSTTSKKRKAGNSSHEEETEASYPVGPPTILSSNSANTFPSLADLTGSVVKNPSSEPIVLSIKSTEQGQNGGSSIPSTDYIVPPQSNFVYGQLPLPENDLGGPPAIPGLPSRPRFNLILFDPPWPNRSVKRSRGYQTHPYNEMADLSAWMNFTLLVHGYDPDDSKIPAKITTSPAPHTINLNPKSEEGFAAIWMTNSEKARQIAYEALLQSRYSIFEEWVWIKVTASGQPVYPVDGLWRKPYEILVIGRRESWDTPPKYTKVGQEVYDAMGSNECTLNDLASPGHGVDVDPSTIPRRVIAAVPDLHSRKPNLKSLFERILFRSDSGGPEATPLQYSALEVFARNLTAEWSACGNEVLKFNARDCWVERDESHGI